MGFGTTSTGCTRVGHWRKHTWECNDGSSCASSCRAYHRSRSRVEKEGGTYRCKSGKSQTIEKRSWRCGSCARGPEESADNSNDNKNLPREETRRDQTGFSSNSNS